MGGSGFIPIVLEFLVADLAHSFSVSSLVFMLAFGGGFSSPPEVVASAAHASCVMPGVGVRAIRVCLLVFEKMAFHSR